MDKSQAIEIAEKFAKLAAVEFKPSRIILYGSYARGNWNQDSDIDIAVVVNNLNSDYLNILTSLYKLRRKVDINIEPVLLIENHDPSGFLETIENYGEILYSEAN